MPATHGSCADAPRGQKLPRPQVLHAFEPEASWKLPATHCAHMAWPDTAVNVPGAHCTCAVDPVAHELPLGQSVHCDALPRPTLLEYVPAAHGSCADAPCGQKLPSPQYLQAVDPDASWKYPAVHDSHVG